MKLPITERSGFTQPASPPAPYSLDWVLCLLLSARRAMWSMPVVLTETENENDSANQNDVAKMMLQK